MFAQVIKWLEKREKCVQDDDILCNIS